jgi:hypothetical protein
MKRLIEFTYFSVFTLIPDQATLGKSTGAATLHAGMFSFCVMGIGLWVNEFVIRVKSDALLLVLVILVFGIPFIFNWTYFLNEKRQMSLQAKYGHVTKWKLRLVGVSIILFGFFSFILSGILTGLLSQQK